MAGFGDDPSAAIAAPDRIVIKPGDVIGGERVYLVGGFTLNGKGDVVVSFWNSSDGVLDEIFVATETEILVRKGDIVDGRTIEGAFDAKLNNAGQLAFFASVKNDLGDDRDIVLFADDQIIAAEGDLLDGKVIEQLGRLDINDGGDVAFYVDFEDFSRVIVRANHVQIPEPGGIVLAAMALIAFFQIVRRRSARAIRLRRAPRAEIR